MITLQKIQYLGTFLLLCGVFIFCWKCKTVRPKDPLESGRLRPVNEKSIAYGHALGQFAATPGQPLRDKDAVPGEDFGDFGLFVSPGSVSRQDNLSVHLHVQSPCDIELEFFRVDSSQAGSTRVYQQTVHAEPQDKARAVDIQDLNYLSYAHWRPQLQVKPDPSWLNGLYFARATQIQVQKKGGTRKVQKIFPFVLEDHEPVGQIAVLVPLLTTPTAYNPGFLRSDSSRSLYTGFDEESQAYKSSLRAKSVVMGRPLQQYRAGVFHSRMASLVKFLETEKFGVQYFTELTLEKNPHYLDRFDIIVLAEHPEYVPMKLRQAVVRNIKRGAHLLSLCANSFYWKVDISNVNGESVVTVDKDGQRGQWRQQREEGKALAEQAIFGAMYGAWGGDQTWPLLITPKRQAKARETDPVLLQHWIFANTGLTAGESIPDLIEGEVDWIHENFEQVAWRDAVILESPFRDVDSGRMERAQTLFFVRESGQMTFHASSFNMQKALVSDNPQHRKLRTMMLNILNRMVQWENLGKSL